MNQIKFLMGLLLLVGFGAVVVPAFKKIGAQERRVIREVNFLEFKLDNQIQSYRIQSKQELCLEDTERCKFHPTLNEDLQAWRQRLYNWEQQMASPCPEFSQSLGYFQKHLIDYEEILADPAEYYRIGKWPLARKISLVLGATESASQECLLKINTQELAVNQ